jgi:Mycothiol maleylpyruvate isomerase N-terminal domain
MTTARPAATVVDLRRAPLPDVRGSDLRSPKRDLWADEVALWDRLQASWAGLDDAAWHLPGAAPSDAGGPDWSLAEHVGHLAIWQELAIAYTDRAIETGAWPSDDDFDGGDFDKFNERQRAPWTDLPRDEIIRRLAVSREGLLVVARRLGAAAIRGDAAWGWVYMTLHGHYLDHLAIIEPWASALRLRQIDGDPFVDDPRTDDADDFHRQAAPHEADLDALLGTIPVARWDDDEVTPGWTLRDHLGHLADWSAEGVRAISIFHRRGHWLADPEEGIDAWNERMVASARDESSSVTLARYREATAAMHDAVDTLTDEDLRSPDGWSWAYDCLHGHLRKHLAMIAPWAATIPWPPPAS